VGDEGCGTGAGLHPVVDFSVVAVLNLRVLLLESYIETNCS
jgi:hypothetical protein